MFAWRQVIGGVDLRARIPAKLGAVIPYLHLVHWHAFGGIGDKMDSAGYGSSVAGSGDDDAAGRRGASGFEKVSHGSGSLSGARAG